jgi:flagellar basal body rod protein FlgG
MAYGLYISAAGAEVQSRRLQALANNLANVDTPGFKRELAVLGARQSAAIAKGLDRAGSKSINDVGGGVELVESLADFTRGAMRKTGIDTDVALGSPAAFFVVQRDGQELLTRAGNFVFSTEGLLQTQDGDHVLGEDGPINIDPTQPWRIHADGAISQNNAVVTALRVVKPQSLGDLSKVGDNYFMPLAPPPPAEGNDRYVLPGYLEMSTVKPASEMMELIEASRAYEANVRMIQHHDQLVGSLVNRVLRQA